MRSQGYLFFIGYCLLPVTPPKLNVKYGNANKTITLINEGQVNLLKTPELTDVEFDCEIPQVSQPYAMYSAGFLDAGMFLSYLEGLKKGKQPFQFIVVRSLPNGIPLFSSNMKVSLEDYQVIEEAKNGFDVKIRIKLKQYRHYGTKTVKVSQNANGEASAEVTNSRSIENSPIPTSKQTYIAKAGDTAFTIAKKMYGAGGNYIQDVLNANPILNANSNAVTVGQKLTLPAG